MNTDTIDVSPESPVAPVAETSTTENIAVPRLLSPSRGKPVVRRDAERLHKFAILKGGVLELTESTYAELEQAPWNIKANRVAACICNLRQYYGVNISNRRDGRKVVAYVFDDQ